MEKWRSWADSGGDLDQHVGRDAVLTGHFAPIAEPDLLAQDIAAFFTEM